MHYDFIPNENPSGIPTFQIFQEKLNQLVPPSGPILPGSHTWANLGKGAGTYSHNSYLKSFCSVQIHLRPWWCHDSKTNYPYYADKLAFSVQIVFIVGLFDFRIVIFSFSFLWGGLNRIRVITWQIWSVFQKHHQVLHFFVKKLLSFIFRLSFESHPAPDLDAPAGWKENKSLFLQKLLKMPSNITHRVFLSSAFP